MPRQSRSFAATVLFATIAWVAVTGPARGADVLLNEYNAVDDGDFLGSGGSDPFWQQREGNGGDWFELVVITDHLDMRGWEIIVVNRTGDPVEEESFSIVLSNEDVWSDIRSGTVITISEILANNVDDYHPEVGQWWLNVKASADSGGRFATVSCVAPPCDPEDANWKVSNNDTQFLIRDEVGGAVFGPVGEGIEPLSGVSGIEVFKLEEDPSGTVTPTSSYSGGTSSTFGQANLWGGGLNVQDFSALRSIPYSPLASVRINEVLSHSHASADWVELHNTTASPVNIGDWYLSDSFADLTKFQIPGGTTIPAGGFVVFEEAQLGFAFNSPCGDEVILSAGDGVAPTGPRDFLQFGPQDESVSLGRVPDGAAQVGRLSSPTKGLPNDSPRVGPLLINEIMYHPVDPPPGFTINPEYIEIRNTSPAPVALSVDFGAAGIYPWKLIGGIDFEFDPATSVPGDGLLLVVNFDPVASPSDLAEFESLYSVDPSVEIVGPYDGRLGNLGDTVRLSMPDTPEPDGDICGGVGNPSPFVPDVVVDEVSYFDFGDWPEAADGKGTSLERVDAAAFGQDPGNWAANLANLPTPGATNVALTGLESNEQKCVAALTKDFGKVVKAQSRENYGCLRDAGKNALDGMTADDCLTADRKGKVQKAGLKTSRDMSKRCVGVVNLVEGAPFSALGINAAAEEEGVDGFLDAFGVPFADAVLPSATDRNGAKCQQSVAKSMGKCEDTLLREFANCAKTGLKEGTVATPASLAACLGQDPKGKIANVCDPQSGRLRDTIEKHCVVAGVQLDDAFPGCFAPDGPALAGCLHGSIRCRACLGVRDAFNASADCDGFDNGKDDQSCR